MPRRFQAWMAGTFALLIGFQFSRSWLPETAASYRLLGFSAALAALAFCGSLHEVWTHEQPHPLARRLGLSGFAATAFSAVDPLVFPPPDPLLYSGAAGAMAAASVAYELAHRRLMRGKQADEAAMAKLGGIQEVRVGMDMPEQIRGAFALVVAGAVTLALSVGPAFLTIIPPAWMVARFLNPDTPLDERFGRGSNALPWAGWPLSLRVRVGGGCPPVEFRERYGSQPAHDGGHRGRGGRPCHYRSPPGRPPHPGRAGLFLSALHPRAPSTRNRGGPREGGARNSF